MKKITCSVCCKNKTALLCDSCGSSSCKHCSYFIDEDVFEFLSLLPESIQDKAFCPNCYHDKVLVQLNEYQDLLQQAREVDVFVKDQGSETRLISRREKPIIIKECEGREETLLRIAFIAAQRGFDTIVDVDLKSKKLAKGGTHKAHVWSGSAVPVKIKKR